MDIDKVGLIDPEYLRDHYAALSDEALLAVDGSQLEKSAQTFYDSEIERRGLINCQVLSATSAEPAKPPNPRLKDVKRAALVACIAALVGLGIPMWNFTRQMLSLESRIGQSVAIAVILVVYVFTAILPLFYSALSRNEGDVLVPRNLRWMALTGAVLIGILSVAALPGWMASFHDESALDSASRRWMIGDTSNLLNLITDVTGILLLAAVFRLPDERSSGRTVAISNQLRLLTQIAVIAGAVVAVGCLIGLAATPWVYFYIRHRYLEMGYSNTRWTFSRLAVDRGRAALDWICVYIAPFLVWRGTRRHVTSGCNST